MSEPRVVVPHAPGKLHPITRAVVLEQAPLATFIEMRDDDHYRRLLRSLWERGETFVLVEHDIIPWPGALAELLDCPCQWGTYSYKLHGGIGIAHGFGCAKITHHLIAALPDLWEAECKWNEVDQRLFFAAREIGIEPHLHRPPVTHVSERELGSHAAG